MKIKLLLLSIFFIIFGTDIALAEHPINVQENAINKEYYKAMISFEKLPKQKVTKDVLLAAAQSAWALSLPDKAIELFDSILNNFELSQKERAKIYFFKGIIEFQEERISSAELLARETIKITHNDSLKASALKLLGDCSFKMKQYGQAQKQYTKALEFASKEEINSIYFQRGSAFFYLGKLNEASKDLEKVSLENEDAVSAIKLLIKISLEEKNFKALKHWIKVANTEFSEQFIDSWLDYAKLQLAIHEKDKNLSKKILKEAQEKFPPSDPWINLAMASFETFLWNERIKR